MTDIFKSTKIPHGGVGPFGLGEAGVGKPRHFRHTPSARDIGVAKQLCSVCLCVCAGTCGLGSSARIFAQRFQPTIPTLTSVNTKSQNQET